MQAKKEVSVAIFIGLVICALIIGGLYRAKTALDSHKNINSTYLKPSPTPIAQEETSSLPLKITMPEDNVVVQTPTIELKGNTQKDTYITILTDKNEFIIVPNDLGDFSQELTLVKGANTIKVTVYTPQGDKTEATLSVVYTTAEL